MPHSTTGRGENKPVNPQDIVQSFDAAEKADTPHAKGMQTPSTKGATRSR